jgi:hypothetical protein
MLSFPRGTEMFQFPHLPPPGLCVQPGVMGHDAHRVAPFGYRRYSACLRPTVAFRSLPRPSSARVAQASTAYWMSLERDPSRPRPCPAAANEPLAQSPPSVTTLVGPRHRTNQDAAIRRLGLDGQRRIQTISHLHLLTSSAGELPARRHRRQWVFLDSNQRPLPYQGSALTT